MLKIEIFLYSPKQKQILIKMFKMKLIIAIIFSLFTYSNSMYVSVPTGNVISWYKWKVLQKDSGSTGLHFYNPVTTNYQIVDVTSQKDTIGPINCVSSDKQSVSFPSIQVWNQLPEEYVFKVLSKFEKRDQSRTLISRQCRITLLIFVR